MNVYTPMATEALPWWIHAGLMLALGVTSGALAVALVAGYAYRPGRASREVARRAYLIAVLASVILVPTAIFLDPVVIRAHVLAYDLWPLAVAPVLGVVVLMQDFRRRYFVASLVLLLGISTSLWMLWR